MKRVLATTLLLAILAALLPSPAVAGGNWLELRRPDAPAGFGPSRWDIFATGQTVVARVGYLGGMVGPTDGPFHLWIERGHELEAGSPIPESAIRVGTFRMAASGRGGFATFTMPELPRGSYTLSVCDDPCRTWGFGEFVQGWLTAVRTETDAQFLARIRELRSTMQERSYELRRNIRAAVRDGWRLEDRIIELTDELEATRTELDELRTTSARVSRADSRPVIDAAAGAWIATGLVAAAGLWLVGRRRRSITVPDTPAELLATGAAIRTPPSERDLEDLDA